MHENNRKVTIIVAISSFMTGMALSLIIRTAFYPSWADMEEKEKKIEICKKELEKKRGEEFDVAAANSRAASAELNFRKLMVNYNRETEALKAALARLDADSDKVEIPRDLCPTSKFESGEPTYVNSFGCTYAESADSCSTPTQVDPSKPLTDEQNWLVTDCPLADADEALGFVCVARHNPAGTTPAEQWPVFRDCHPEAPGG